MTSKPPSRPDGPDLPAEMLPADPGLELDRLDLEGASLDRADLTGRVASAVRLDRCRLGHVDLTDAQLSGALVQDSVIEGGSWANTRTRDLRMRRVALHAVRMTGADLSAASLEDVSLRDCRIDLGSFRFAKLNRVAFEGCRLDEVDFSGAELTSVTFNRCTLTRAVWTEATLTRCEMRGSDITGAIDAGRLRGVRMPWVDVLAAAGELAAAIGIEIVE